MVSKPKPFHCLINTIKIVNIKREKQQKSGIKNSLFTILKKIECTQ